MKYQKIKELPAEKFRRETGVKTKTFNQMIEVINIAEKEIRKKGKLRVTQKIKILADTGSIGIKKIMSNSEIPHKKSRKHKLTKEEKLENKEIASKKIVVENVTGSVKRFRILSERYRNRRKRFGLRFNLIAGIHNFELEM